MDNFKQMQLTILEDRTNFLAKCSQSKLVQGQLSKLNKIISTEETDQLSRVLLMKTSSLHCSSGRFYQIAGLDTSCIRKPVFKNRKYENNQLIQQSQINPDTKTRKGYQPGDPVVGVSPCTPKGLRFNCRLEHVPRMQL